MKGEALDRTMWRNRFGGGFGPVVRQNIEWMNEWSKFIFCGTYSEFCYKSLKNIRLLMSVPATKKLRELMLLLEFFFNQPKMKSVF